MKKIYFLFFVLILAFFLGIFVVSDYKKNSPIVNSDGTLEYDFSYQYQKRASRILYKYVLNNFHTTAKEAEESFNITKSSVRAFETDLNNDGKNEIIGFVYAGICWGTAGYSLFILENKNKSFEEISYILNFEPQKKIYVLPEKNENYKNIKFYGSSAFDFKSLIASYKNGKYVNFQQTELLEKYLKDFSGYDVSEITNINE